MEQNINKKEKTSCQDDCCIEEVGETVQRLVRVMQLFERDQIKPFGFTTSQCYVLIELNKVQKLTMNEISDKMNLSTSTMTRVINNLVRDNFVKRIKDENDRRIVYVTLTEEGANAANDLELSIKDYYRKIVDYLPQGQVDDVLNAVSLLVNAFDKANPNCC